MPQFTDSQGQLWKITITIGTIKRIKADLTTEDGLAVDLLYLESGTPPLVTRLGTDVMLIVDVIFALVEKQAEELGIDGEAFAERLEGDAAAAAFLAFNEALILFFRQLGRTERARMIERQLEVIRQQTDAFEDIVNEIDFDTAMDEITSQGRQLITEAINQATKPPTPGSSSIDSPAIADSTPSRSPSASSSPPAKDETAPTGGGPPTSAPSSPS